MPSELEFAYHGMVACFRNAISNPFRSKLVVSAFEHHDSGISVCLPDNKSCW
ncbi:conserved hypothetical protein [Ricinus communis]|uniref:Uncharacterized protein n=1 Tax=Ricinus communis TaxID=3988 RepID=B9RRW4_RICCO|nr:conserved hypothetical protein [Ricinus communis]